MAHVGTINASGNCALAFGYMDGVEQHPSYNEHIILANGISSYAGGCIQEAGNSSIISNGKASIARGYVRHGSIESSGNGAVAIGCASSGNIIASGAGAVAMGINTKASGNGAVALGIETHTTNDGETVVGKYNHVGVNYAGHPLFIVGCGTPEHSKNAFEVHDSGITCLQ